MANEINELTELAYEGSAKVLEADATLQARLLGVVHQELTAA